MALWLHGSLHAMICTHRISPACGIPRFLSRFARRAGLVHLRQTFVLRCHGDNGWPLRAEASFTRRFPLIVETLARLTYALGKPKPRTSARSSDAPAVKRE